MATGFSGVVGVGSGNPEPGAAGDEGYQKGGQAGGRAQK